MSTTTNPVTSAERHPLTRITVWSERKEVNHGATTGTISNGCAATAIENTPTVTSTEGSSLNSESVITVSPSLTGGTGCR